MTKQVTNFWEPLLLCFFKAAVFKVLQKGLKHSSSPTPTMRVSVLSCQQALRARTSDMLIIMKVMRSRTSLVTACYCILSEEISWSMNPFMNICLAPKSWWLDWQQSSLQPTCSNWKANWLSSKTSLIIWRLSQNQLFYTRLKGTIHPKKKIHSMILTDLNKGWMSNDWILMFFQAVPIFYLCIFFNEQSIKLLC